MNGRYTKHDIIKKVVNRLKGTHITVGGNKHAYKRKYHLKYSQEIVANVINEFLDVLADTMEEGDSVSIYGYLTIEPQYRNARKGRNTIKTGELIDIPPRYRPKAEFGKRFRDACKNLTQRELGGLNDETNK